MRSRDHVTEQRTEAEEGREPAAPRAALHIAAHDGSRLVNIPISTIAAIESDGERIQARTVSGSFQVKKSLKELERRLPSPPFLRISRTAIVNVAWVDHIEPGPTSAHVLRLRQPFDNEISVPRRRVRQLRQFLGA